ncbi:major histocompatibility complex class I-related gene protein-like [Neosynchiropus ocellatus]
MKKVVFLLALWLHSSAAVTHTYHYIYTASAGVPNFPEFVAVGHVDGVEVNRYDSNSRRFIPKQDWMIEAKADEPDFWETYTNVLYNHQQVFKNSIEVAKQRFNQTGGVHIFQRMYGCEWDDETGEVKGYDQFAYDGEDFIAFDLQTLTWVAPSPKAVITKHKWDQNEADSKYLQRYYTQECPTFLKKFVKFGSKTLMRTERPRIALLQKTDGSPITCHATGFYPDRAMLFWTKEGEELHEDVEHGEILPNPDGTFQKMVDLKLSDPSEDWSKYECVFQLDGIKDDIVTKLDRAKILSNSKTQCRGKTSQTIGIIVGVAAAVAVVVMAAAGYFICKKKKKAVASSDLPPEQNPLTQGSD